MLIGNLVMVSLEFVCLMSILKGLLVSLLLRPSPYICSNFYRYLNSVFILSDLSIAGDSWFSYLFFVSLSNMVALLDVNSLVIKRLLLLVFIIAIGLV